MSSATSVAHLPFFTVGRSALCCRGIRIGALVVRPKSCEDSSFFVASRFRRGFESEKR